MQKVRLKKLIDKLLQEIEEEDIGISLFLTCYQDPQELSFFKNKDLERIACILKIVAEDSKRHKEILEKIIRYLGQKYEKSVSQNIMDA